MTTAIQLEPVKGVPKESQALLATAVLAIRVDGKLQPGEVDSLHSMMLLSGAFTDIPDADSVIASTAAGVTAESEENVLRWIADVLPQEQRETAYAWAVEMAHADGRVVGPEHRFLNRVREIFGIPGPLAGKIKTVIAILNRHKQG